MSTVTTDQTLTLTRRIKASRERVFAAFTTAEAIRQWFGPLPGGNAKVTHDFRVGGAYRFEVVCSPDGSTAVAVGVYREITPPSRIAYTWKWEGDEDWADVESTVTFEFRAIGDETEVILTHTGFPSDESRGSHSQGWIGTLAKLESHLA